MFDDSVDRSDSSTEQWNESNFDFWNRIAGPVADRVRDRIDVWCSNYPSDKFARFKKEACNPKNDFHAYFYELFWHEFWRLRGVNPCVEVALTGGSVPEFLLPFKEGKCVFEATVCYDETNNPSGKKKRFDQVCDRLNRLDCNCVIDIHRFKEKTKDNPQPKRIAASIEKQLTAFIRCDSSQQELSYMDERVEIKYTAHRCDRADGQRITRILPARWMQNRPEEALKKQLRDKSNQHDVGDSSYLIAADAQGAWLRDDNVWTKALFGDTETNEETVHRKRNGFFGSESGPKRQHVSGVIRTCLDPTNVARAELCLFHNPFCHNPFAPEYWPMRQIMLVDGNVNITPAKESLSAVMELPGDWPGGGLFDHVR